MVCVTAFDGARPGDDGESRASKGRVCAGKGNDRILCFHVAAHQFVGLADADQFLHAGHLVQRARLDFGMVSRNADGSTLRARHGMGAVSQFLNLLANGAYLLFCGLRLHYD